MERIPKYRAFVNVQCHTLIANEPEGTGSSWISKEFMCEVLQLNLSTGNMRVRYEKGGTTDVPIHNLMQYTGLSDKNGKEIYEGDIVEAKSFLRQHWLRHIGNRKHTPESRTCK